MRTTYQQTSLSDQNRYILHFDLRISLLTLPDLIWIREATTILEILIWFYDTISKIINLSIINKDKSQNYLISQIINRILQVDAADIVCFSREINFKSLVTGSSKLWLYHFLWYTLKSWGFKQPKAVKCRQSDVLQSLVSNKSGQFKMSNIFKHTCRLP